MEQDPTTTVIEVVGKDGEVAKTIHLPLSRRHSRCKKHLRISTTTLMILYAIIPFIVVTVMHIIFATSCPGRYTLKVALILILLNVLCILPYISWLAFIIMLIWLSIELSKRSTQRCRPSNLVAPREEITDMSSAPTNLSSAESSLLESTEHLDSSISTVSTTTFGGDELRWRMTDKQNRHSILNPL